MITTTSIGVVILAAGTSSRMGKIKQLLPWKNTTLLGHAIEVALQSKVGPVAVVLGANFESISQSINEFINEAAQLKFAACSQVIVLRNAAYAEGPGTSIATGARWAKNKNFRGILILLADQPQITPEILRQIVSKSAEGETAITGSRYAGSVGVPAFFGAGYFNELIELSPAQGAKVLFGKHSNHLSEVIVPEAELDLDTEAEYKLACDSDPTSFRPIR